ncbi:MAG: InlB B-repeat-containing protein, partial [Oscillospiraceae bacterium]|nr:InlB B-repeat-containing protein [Oscillospiraceae bacterium]
KITAEDDSGASMTTAKENNTVYVTSTTGEAYNNGKKLTAGADGRFSFVVEPGGGILLSIFKKVDPKPQASSPVVAASYKLKFDFDGGVLDGETELEMKCSAGQHIRLPEAPVKDGFVFAGWQTEVRGKTVVFEAGAKYTVSAGKSFVALWEEA